MVKTSALNCGHLCGSKSALRSRFGQKFCVWFLWGKIKLRTSFLYWTLDENKLEVGTELIVELFLTTARGLYIMHSNHFKIKKLFWKNHQGFVFQSNVFKFLIDFFKNRTYHMIASLTRYYRFPDRQSTRENYEKNDLLIKSP